jgi:hypothetical protein
MAGNEFSVDFARGVFQVARPAMLNSVHDLRAKGQWQGLRSGCAAGKSGFIRQ